MFGGGEKRKGFVRTAVPGTERTISWIVLLIVLGIGAAIYMKGQRFDPGLFSLDQSLLAEASAPARQEVQLTEDADEGIVSGIRPSSASAPEGATELLKGLAAEGWRQMGSVEAFTAGTLYEKINGRAEQYLAYDVVGLTCVSLVDGAERFIDVFAYDMGKPINAFGIFSVERSEGQPAIDLGRGGYGVEASFFLWKGGHYVQVLAAGTEEDLRQAALEIAGTVSDRLTDSGEPVWGFTALPEEDRIEGTIQYFLRDALSLDFLGNTFTARYLKNGKEITAFLSRQASIEASGDAYGAYSGYISDYGSVVATREIGGGNLVVGDMGGFFDVVFRKGSHLGGVTSAPDRDLAEQLASDLVGRIN